MRYVVAYDISADKSRKKVADLLAGVLARVQYSVFEGEAPEKVLRRTVDRALPFLDPKTDSLRVYRLCAACTAKAEAYGAERPVVTEPVQIL